LKDGSTGRIWPADVGVFVLPAGRYSSRIVWPALVGMVELFARGASLSSKSVSTDCVCADRISIFVSHRYLAYLRVVVGALTDAGSSKHLHVISLATRARRLVSQTRHGHIASTDPPSNHPQGLHQPRHRVLQICSQHVRPTRPPTTHCAHDRTGSCSSAAYTPRTTFTWSKSTARPCSSHRTSHSKTTSIGGSPRERHRGLILTHPPRILKQLNSA
jgi:hypothetical protein